MEEPAPGPTSDPEVTMELALQEDVDAELEDFLLLSLLRIDDEAKDVVRAVLWRHLRHFSVFAEIAGFAIDRNDSALLNELITTMSEARIEFQSKDEMMFLQIVDALARHESTPLGMLDVLLREIQAPESQPSSIMVSEVVSHVYAHLHGSADPNSSIESGLEILYPLADHHTVVRCSADVLLISSSVSCSI